AFDLQRVDALAQERLQPRQERLALAPLPLAEPRVGVDQVEPQPPEEQLLAEARPLPALARRLGDLAGALLRRLLLVPVHPHRLRCRPAAVGVWTDCARPTPGLPGRGPPPGGAADRPAPARPHRPPP